MKFMLGIALAIACGSLGACNRAPNETTQNAEGNAAAKTSTPLPNQGGAISARNVQEQATPTPSAPRAAGPVIKGVYLGMTMDQLVDAYEKNIRPRIHEANNDRVKYFNDAESIQKALADQADDPNGNDYNPCLMAVKPFGADGHMLSVYSSSTDPFDKTKSFRECQFWVHANANQIVDALYMSEFTSNLLFEANNMDVSSFYQTFVNAYGIPTLHMTENHVGNMQAGFITTGSASYESPNGWRIDLKNKSFLMKSVGTQASRFN